MFIFPFDESECQFTSISLDLNGLIQSDSNERI